MDTQRKFTLITNLNPKLIIKKIIHKKKKQIDTYRKKRILGAQFFRSMYIIPRSNAITAY